MTEDPLRLCLAGRLPPGLALARLLLQGISPEGIIGRVQALRTDWLAWHRLADMAQPTTLRRLRRLLDEAGLDHESAATPAAIGHAFDRAAAISPEAGVALYSLGDPAVLAEAAEEIACWLEQEGLVGRAAEVLDLGCGIGRMALALTERARTVLGLDVSARMVAKARQRCAGFGNLTFRQTGGADLADLPSARFDLVLAVDSFPYLHLAAAAERHVEDAARILRPDGALAIFNLSYRADIAADCAEAARWAACYGFALRRCGVTPFQAWDGRAFVLQRR